MREEVSYSANVTFFQKDFSKSKGYSGSLMLFYPKWERKKKKKLKESYA